MAELSPVERQRLRTRAALVSVLVGAVLLVVKVTAYTLTDSLMLLADALESVVHVGTTLVMFWCLRVAQAPPDQGHPYGHGRATSLSVGFEGGMVALAGVGVLWEVAKSLWHPHAVGAVGTGLWLSGVAALVNLALGWWLVRVGQRTRSPILVADGHHVLSDVYTSAGALVGLGLVWWTDLAWIDAVVAAGLALLLLGAGLRLMHEAVAGLMDQADPAMLEKVVAVLNELRDPEWLDVHNLRLRLTGDQVYVDCHLVVPAQWSVARAHHVSEAIEVAVLARLGLSGAVFVHLDHPERPEYRSLLRTGGTWPLTVADATRLENHPDSAVMA